MKIESLESRYSVKLNEILDILYQDELNPTPDSNFSFLSGMSGHVFTLMHLAHSLDNEQCYERAFNLLEIIINSLGTRHLNHTYSSGLTGVAWVINYCIKHDFIEVDSEELLEEIDSVLIEYCSTLDFSTSPNLDFLHGLMGVAFYFLDRPQKNDVLEIILKHIEEQAILEEDGSYKWVNHNPSEGRYSYDLGLAHGISSNIGILIGYYERGLFVDRTQKLLKGAIRFLLKQQQDPNKFYSYFPSSIPLETPTNWETRTSRLGWCYGDLGIAYQLYKAGFLFDDATLSQLSLKIFEHNANRRNHYGKHNIYDAGLCHGTTSAYLIYRLMFNKTNNSIFKEVSDFWGEKTLSFANHEDGLAGFKCKIGNKYFNNSGLLNGVSGIALSLDTLIQGEVKYPWYSFLLL